MLDSLALGKEAVEHYRRDGFVHVPGLVPADGVARLREWVDEIVSWPETPGRHMVYYEDTELDPPRRVLSRIENFCPFHAGMDALLRGPGMLRCLEQALDAPAVLFKDKINFKLPGGRGFKAHQDVQAGWDAYAPLHVTVLVSIDAATEDNGCLELAADRHRAGLLGDAWEPLDEDRDDISYRSCPTGPGDAVFFDSFVPHRSGPNYTDEARRILYVTYNRAIDGDHRRRYYADKRQSFPPDCEREPGKSYTFRV